MRKIQKMKRSTSKQVVKKFKRKKEILLAYKHYIKQVQKYIKQIQETLKEPVATDLVNVAYSAIIYKNIKNPNSEFHFSVSH